VKLLSSTQISWNEPLFFLIRIREAWGWRRRLLIALGISVVMFLAIFFFRSEQIGIPAAIGIGLAAGFALVALCDKDNIQREVTVKEDGIIVNSAVGWRWFQTFPFDAITAVELMCPEEWDKPNGGMVIRSPDDNFLLAVPRKRLQSRPAAMFAGTEDELVSVEIFAHPPNMRSPHCGCSRISARRKWTPVGTAR